MKNQFAHRSSRWLALALLLPLAPSWAADKIAEWAKLMPKETMIYLSVENVPQMIKDWDASALGRFMEDEATQKWMAPLYPDGVAAWDKAFLEKTGSKLRQAFEGSSGSTLVGFVVPAPGAEAPPENPDYLAFSEVEDAAYEATQNRLWEAEKLKNAALKGAMEEVAGHQVHVLGKDAQGEGDRVWKAAWVVVDHIAIEATTRTLMEHALGSLKGPGEANGLSENLARVTQLQANAPDLSVFVDLAKLVEMLNQKMMADMGKGQPQGPNPMMFIGLLGLEELKGLGLSFDLAAERFAVDLSILHTDDPKGILPTLMRGKGLATKLPGFVPVDAHGASVATTSIKDIYTAIMTAIEKLGPMAAMVQQQIAATEQQVGVSLEKDLIGSIGDEIVQIQQVGKSIGEESQVIALKLKDRAQFTAALNAVIKLAGNGFGVFEESEIEGVVVQTLKPSLTAAKSANGESQRISYAITDDYCFISSGTSNMMQKVLKRLKSPEGDSLWDLPSSQTAMAALAKGYTGVGVSNPAAVIGNVIEMIGKTGMADGKTKAKAGAKNDGWFDSKAVPSEEVFAKYFGLSASAAYSEPDVTHFQVLAMPKENQ
jgi:hypothetical protein